MNIIQPIALIKIDDSSIEYFKLKKIKTVLIWSDNILTEMSVVLLSSYNETIIKSIHNYSSEKIFIIDANRFMSEISDGQEFPRGCVLELNSIEASKKTFWIKNKERFFGVLND